MSWRQRARWSARALVLLVLGLSPLAGSSGWGVALAQDAEEGQFGERVEVRLVNVEAWVTDGKGHPVSGLTVDDFEVFEDGELVTISHFAEVQGSRPVLPELDLSPEELEMVTEAGPVVPHIEPSHLILYFDHLHLSPTSRPRLIKDVRKFLASQDIDPARVMILSQTRDLVNEVPFGSTQEEIDAALDRIEKAGTGGSPVEREKRLELDGLQNLWENAKDNPGARGGIEDVCAYFMPRAVPRVEAFMRMSRYHIAASLGHLSAVTGFLNGVPGVKTLLYLSDSLERSPGASLAKFINNLCPGWPDSKLIALGEDLAMDFTSLTSHANANRVTIYSMQTTGLQTSLTGSADQRSLDFQGSQGLDFTIRETDRGGMAVLADETGGRLIYNRNRFVDALGEIVTEMDNYYSLGYVPSHDPDQAEHRIEVKLRQDARGLQIRHRLSYRDKSADELMAEQLEGAVYLGLIKNPLDVKLGAGAVDVLDNGRFSLPLHVIVPVESLVFLPGEDGETARVSIRVDTHDTRRGKGVSEHQSVRVAKPPPGEELVAIVLRIELPAGIHVVAAGVRDDVSREASFVSTTVELADAPAAADASSG